MTRVGVVLLATLLVLSMATATAAPAAGAANPSVDGETDGLRGEATRATTDTVGSTASSGATAAAGASGVAPVAAFTIDPPKPAVGETVTFNASGAVDPDGEIVEYDWRVSGQTANGTTTGSGQTFEYTVGRLYSPPTSELVVRYLHVQLRVTDADNDTRTLTRLVQVDTTSEEGGDEADGTDRTDDDGDPVPVEGFETEKPPRGVEIPFLSGPVTLEEGLDPDVTETDRETVWTVVQFRGRPSAETIDRLDELGYRQRSALTDDTYYAGIPRESAEEVAGLESVRAVADVEPDWKLPPALAERLDDDESDERVRVTVRSFEPIDEQAAELGLVRVRERTYRGRLTAAAIRDLRASEVVRWIEPYAEPRIDLAEGSRMIAAERAAVPSVDGTGVRVGVVDTGIDHDHPHFSGVTVVDSFDEVDGDTNPEADDWSNSVFNRNGHGSHVAGTIAGRSTVGGRNLVGIAPNATLVVARGLGEDQFDRVNNGTEIISNSWSGGTGGQYASRVAFTDRWARAHPQTLLVVSYGNYNASNPSEQYAGAPSIAKNALTVGTINDGTRWISDPPKFGNTVDRVNNVDGLNNLTQPKDGRRKPDVNAPGAWITSAVPNGTYATLTGSSMATPHVSGIAALYEDEYDGRNPDANEIKAAIVATTGPVENPNPSERPEGHGAADAHNAVYNNSYESTSVNYHGDLRPPFPTANEHEFEVAADAEKVVVSLSWLDPPGSPATTDTLVNDLDLYVGPKSDPKRYSVTDRDNSLNRIAVDDLSSSETGTTWVVTVEPHDMWTGIGKLKARQDYDGRIRVVTEPPALSVTVPDRILVDPQPNAVTAFDLNVDGTGAPVHGIRARVTNDSRLGACPGAGTNPPAFVIGTRSDDYTDWSEQLCFAVPEEAGTYPVTITVNSTNADRTTIRKEVTIVVPEPRVRLEPFERNVTVGERTNYRLVAENVSGGVGAYEVNVSLDRPPIGTLTDVTVDGGPTSETTTYGPNADWVVVEASGMDTGTDYGTATIGVLEAEGTNVGKSNISVEVGRLDDESGDAYPLRPQGIGLNPTVPSDGLLNVTRGAAEVEVSIPPGDGNDDSSVVVGDPVTIGIDESLIVAEYDAGVASVEWTLGDGTTATGLTTEHTYEEPGAYRITAAVLLDDGRTVEVARDVTVDPEGRTVRLEPSERTVRPDGTATIDVVVTDLEGGVGSYELEMTTSDTSRARITAVDNRIGGSEQVDLAEDGSGVRFGAFAGDTDDAGTATVATVTVAGVEPGDATLSTTVESVSNESGYRYEIADTEPATVTVREDVQGPDVVGEGRPALDHDGDGVYEDVNGDGATTAGDATVLFNAVFEGNAAVTNNADKFDVNQDGDVTAGDANVLFQEAFARGG